MTLHSWLPLAAFVLDVGLAGLALLRHPGHRLSRLFAYVVGTMALWNLGVFVLRRTADPGAALAWEIFVHVWIVASPALYLHFVLAYLDATVRRRAWLLASYSGCAVFAIANLAAGGLFVAGVRQTSWGWAPVPGPLFALFFAGFHAVLLIGLVELGRAAHRETGVRRARTRVLFAGATIAIVGGAIDLVRLAPPVALPSLEWLYPVGVPANVACAVAFGAAIARHRLFDLDLIARKLAVYAAIGAALIAMLIGLAWTIERAFSLTEVTALLVTVPLGVLLTLLLSPAGHRAAGWIERALFRRRRGCQETLLALGREMRGILAYDTLVERLVNGLTTGIPVTHAALLVRDDGGFLRLRGPASAAGEIAAGAREIGGRLVQWLETIDGAVLKDEAMLDPRTARDLGGAIEELDQLEAAVLIPLKSEERLRAVLLVGEKRSGDIFHGDELEMLGSLASQAAVSLANATLYELAREERRRVEALYELARRLASADDGEEVLRLAVEEVCRLLGLHAAALRLVEGDDLVLRAATGAWAAARPRLVPGESLTGLVILDNAPVVVEDVVADPRFDATHKRVAAEAGLAAFVGVPIRQAGGAPLGVLFGYSRERRAFSPDEVSLLSAFADQVSVSLEKERLAAERRRAQENARQSEKLATMGQLLAGVAHELNNPLSVVVGYSGIVRARMTDAALQSAAEQIETAGHRCARIVRNFLALARKHPPERGCVALNELVTESVELLAYALRVDNVDVHVDLAADVPALWADRNQLQQVLVNLVTNAHHAMREVPARRLLVTTRHDAERARVVLRLADSGPGVPEALRGRIFEPFFTTKPAGLGTGLGLSLCLGIVEAHGGTLGLEDAAAPGAVFRLELPVEMPADVRVDRPRAAAPASHGAATVLVVDDEPAVTQLLTDMLSVDGCRVETATSGAVALDKLAGRAYDIVVTDIRMPGIDGPTLYRHAARVCGGAPPAFIFMTGDLLAGQTAQFLESTAAPCLRKPFVLDDVRRVMAEVRRPVRSIP